jgi:enolase
MLLKDADNWQLPVPLGNIVGGGAHSLGPAPDMQEHMAIPLGAKTVRQAIELNLQVHKMAGLILEKKGRGFAGGMDDEDAWAADLNDIEAIDVVLESKKRVEDAEGIEIRMGLDLAADRMWDRRKSEYVYEREGVSRSTQSQLEYVLELIERYNLAYVEDAFTSTDYESFAKLNASAGPNCLISADDIYATNIARTKVGVEARSARAMIVKPNQIGTLTGAARTAAFARANGLIPIISNRSGETPDTSIAPLAVAWGTSGIKAGVRGGGRIIKLNELIRIEEAVEGIQLARWPLLSR